MENFVPLKGTDTLAESREKINDMARSGRSLSGGTSFPTDELYDGMLCYRTDMGRIYQYQASTDTWIDKVKISIDGSAESANSVKWSAVQDKPKYAVSDTEGGAATSAKKLETARKINGQNFDGTADIDISIPQKATDNEVEAGEDDSKYITPKQFSEGTKITVVVIS